MRTLRMQELTEDMEEMMKYLSYCQETGIFTWTESRGNVKAGSIAGYTRKDTGLVEIYFNKHKHKAHRLAIFAVEGELHEEDLITHIDENNSNNAYSNLRKTSRTTLCRTSTIQHNNTTGHRGISFNQERRLPYIVRIRVNGKEKWIGSYETIDEAIIARGLAKQEYGY